MSEYTPDRWIVIEIVSGDYTARKILSAYYGGYLNGDSWRLSSGIVKVIDNNKYYEIENESGSVYTCYKNAYGVSGLSGGVLNNWLNQAEERDDFNIKTLSMEEIV
jgi:hypothetical protein